MALPPPAFLALVDRTCKAIEDRDVHVFYVSRCHIASVCPVCRHGAVSIRFIETDPPRLRIERDGCTGGCTARDIARVLV